MSPEQLAQEALAAQFIAVCRKGFQNEFHWAAWAAKHRREIDAMPPALRASVLAAWNNASTPEASRASARSARVIDAEEIGDCDAEENIAARDGLPDVGDQ